MSSVQPEEEESTSNQLRCEKCNKQYSKPSNLKRHIKQKHSAGSFHSPAASELQSADSETEMDDSQSLPCHDSDDDDLLTESLFEERHLHSASAPPTIPAPPQDSDELQMISYPLPPALPTSRSTLSAVRTNTNPATTLTTMTTGDGLSSTDAWLITGSVAPRSYPAGWSLHPASNSITSAPRMASPLPESFGQTWDPSLVESGQAQSFQPHESSQGIVPTAELFGQALDPLADHLNRTSSPASPDLGSMQEHTGQSMNELAWNFSDFDQTGSPIPEHTGQSMNQLARDLSDFDQTGSPTPEHTGQSMDQLAGELSQTSSPTPQDFSQMLSPTLQNFDQTTDQPARNFSPTSIPMPQGFSHSFGSMPQSFEGIMNQPAGRSRTSSPVP